MASCAGPIGAASPPARYILSGICRASGRGCRSEAARVFSWVAMPPAVSAFEVVACCFPPVGAASLVNLLQVLLWFRPSFGFVFGRLRRVSCSRCIYTCYHLKCLCGPSARFSVDSARCVHAWRGFCCFAWYPPRVLCCFAAGGPCVVPAAIPPGGSSGAAASVLGVNGRGLLCCGWRVLCSDHFGPRFGVPSGRGYLFGVLLMIAARTLCGLCATPATQNDSRPKKWMFL